jgi:hypothetical protein
MCNTIPDDITEVYVTEEAADAAAIARRILSRSCPFAVHSNSQSRGTRCTINCALFNHTVFDCSINVVANNTLELGRLLLGG